jgi:acetoin:2,6-dichlorophenolindophenol oxidoreductase subunit beta
MTGMRPIVEIMFMDFIAIALDEIINQAAKIHYMFYGQAKVPLVIRTVVGAGLGHAAQHSQSLEALVTHIPGLKVVMPSTPYDAKGLLISSINDDSPVIFIEHKLLYKDKNFLEEVPEETYEIPIGKGDIKRKGNDISIIATSFMVKKALEASNQLKEEKIDCEVIDLRSLKPLDIDIVLESIKKTGRLLCVEEACSFGGYMGEVVSQVVEKGFDYLDAPIIRVASKNCPIPYSLPLEEEVIPNIDKIKEGVLKVLKGA